MTKKLTAAAIAVLTTSSLAYAAPCGKTGFYVGGGIGFQNTKVDVKGEGTKYLSKLGRRLAGLEALGAVDNSAYDNTPGNINNAKFYYIPIAGLSVDELVALRALLIETKDASFIPVKDDFGTVGGIWAVGGVANQPISAAGVITGTVTKIGVRNDDLIKVKTAVAARITRDSNYGAAESVVRASGTNFAAQLCAGYGYSVGRMYVGGEALLGTGTGRAKVSGAKDYSDFVAKAQMFYGARVHLGMHFTKSTCGYVILGGEAQRYKMQAWVASSSSSTDTTPTGKKTYFGFVAGLGLRAYVMPNVSVSLEHTLTFCGDKKIDMKAGGSASSSSSTVFPLEKVKATNHRTMAVVRYHF